MLFFLLSLVVFVFGQLDTTPTCEPYGVDKCYDCAFSQDMSSFATHPEMGVNIFCINCYTGYYPLAGVCYSMEELLADLQVSIVNDIAVFQSDLLLNAYKTMWTWQSGVASTDFDNYDTLGYIAQEVLGDNYDYLFVSSYEDVPALACAEQTNEENCNYVGTCQWMEDETCLSTASYPDRYHTHNSQIETGYASWQPYIYESKLQGVIRYNYKRTDVTDPNLSAYDMFNTHFHEIAHHHLVHGMELNPDNPHWGYSVLERQAEMAAHTWLPEEVSCFETGEPVTSAESCPPSADGKHWLHFESSVEMVSNFTFSDWELLPMGLLHPDDLQGETFFFCASTSQEVPHEKVNTETGVKVGCNSVVFVTPEEWAWGEEYINHVSYEWQKQEVPFKAAHMVLQSSSQQLPTTHDEINAYWKAAADLLPELEDDFITATRGHGELDFTISDPEPECYIFRDDHSLEGEWTIVGGLGAFTMEECEVQCSLREDCTAWRGSPYSNTDTYYEVTGEQNGMEWVVSYCTLYTGEVTYTPAESTQNNAYGPNPPANVYWSGELVFPIPEGCEADGLTFPPTDLPTTAPSTEIPLCYLPHNVYALCSQDTEYPVDGEQITEEECEALCSQDTECFGWQYPTWCTHLKESTCVWSTENGEWSTSVSYQKNPDYFPESCVNPPTPEPTTTAEPTLHPTMENGLAPCYYQFTDAQVVGGQWDSEADISEEECEAICTQDEECVGYSMQYDVWSSSSWSYYDKCWNYHGATEWNAGFYTWAEVISYKKVLPAPANCLPTFEATLEPTVATLEPTMATNEPTEATEEPTEATLEPTVSTLEPTEATLEPTVSTIEPTMATNEPTEATLEPTEATLEPTMATQEPTESTSEPTQATTESASQTAVKFTQTVSATDVECEEAKDDVQSANALTLGVSASSVDVSGCERRMLAADTQAATYEFLISIMVDTDMDADQLQAKVSDDSYAVQVSQRLVAAIVTSSSKPVVEHASSVEASDSQADSINTYTLAKFGVIIMLVAAVVVGLTYCCLSSLCKSQKNVVQKESTNHPLELVL